MQRRKLMRPLLVSTPPIAEQRTPFTPPTPSQALRIRSIIPLTSTSLLARKRVLEVHVGSLPLVSDAARHRFKLLAGPRWTPAHGDAAKAKAGPGAEGLEHKRDGWFKMSEESFPEGSMNQQWMIDTVRKMVAEANVRVRA